MSLEAEQEREQRAANEIDELRLPETGVSKEVLADLRAGQRRLSGVETDLRQDHLRLSESEAEAQRARDLIGDHLTDDQLKSIETVEIGEVSVFSRRADQCRAKEEVLEEKSLWLDREEPEEVQGLTEEQLHDGITSLGHWLASSEPVTKRVESFGGPVIVASVVIAALSCILTLALHWAWILLMALPVVVLAWDRLLRRSRATGPEVNAQEVHRESYEMTQLQSPESWEVSAVSDLLRRLTRLAGVRAQENERARKRDDLRLESDALEQQRRELDDQRAKLEERLGLSIELADEWLPLLIDNIGRWQQRSTEAEGVRERLAALEQEQKELLKEINDALCPFGYDEARSAESIAHLIDDLDDRKSRYQSAVVERADAKQRIEHTINPSLAEVARERQEIFKRLELDESEEAAIDDWLVERPGFLELKNELAAAVVIRDDRKEALTGHESPPRIRRDRHQAADRRTECHRARAGTS